MDAKRLVIDALGFGGLLWMIGFTLGMVFFPFVAAEYLGIPILAILVPVTLVVAYYRLRRRPAPATHILIVAVMWLGIALLFDYLFLVKAFHVSNYYDLDVVVYYGATLLVPLAAGFAGRMTRAPEPPRP